MVTALVPDLISRALQARDRETDRKNRRAQAPVVTALIPGLICRTLQALGRDSEDRSTLNRTRDLAKRESDLGEKRSIESVSGPG